MVRGRVGGEAALPAALAGRPGRPFKDNAQADPAGWGSAVRLAPSADLPEAHSDDPHTAPRLYCAGAPPSRFPNIACACGSRPGAA